MSNHTIATPITTWAELRGSDLAAAYRGLENGTKQPPSAKRRRKGLATSTVARYANWVNTIFLAAQDEGLIVKNPANSKHAGRPKGPTSRRVKPFSIWDVDELSRFCDWALANDKPWARAWVILARTGLRSGELLGLPWGDIDFNKSEMRIERALHCDEALPLGERFVIGPVKGGRPRTVTFDRTCALLLQDWRKVVPSVLAGATGNVTPLRACDQLTRCSHRCPGGRRHSPPSCTRSCGPARINTPRPSGASQEGWVELHESARSTRGAA